MTALAAAPRPRYQLMPDLTPTEMQWLRGDIAERGVLVPVEVDENGDILDGHHRVRVADELGIEYPTIVRTGMTERQKRAHVYSLNLVRRQLSGHDRQAVIAQMRTEGMSLRAIGRAVGVNASTVSRTLRGVANATPADHDEPEPYRAPEPPAPTRAEVAASLAAEGLTQAEIAREMGLDPSLVQRLVKPRENQRSPGADLPADWTQTRQWLAAVKELPSKSPDPRLVARSVPERNRAGVARSLRQVGTFLGSIALELERSER